MRDRLEVGKCYLGWPVHARKNEFWIRVDAREGRKYRGLVYQCFNGRWIGPEDGLFEILDNPMIVNEIPEEEFWCKIVSR